MLKLAGFGTVAHWEEAPDHVQHGLQGDDRGRRRRLLRRVHGGRGVAVHVPQRHRVRHDAQVLQHEILPGIRYQQSQTIASGTKLPTEVFPLNISPKHLTRYCDFSAYTGVSTPSAGGGGIQEEDSQEETEGRLHAGKVPSDVK